MSQVPVQRRAPLWRVLRTAFEVALVLGLLAVGLWLFPLALFAPGLQHIPGDLGDARFNNYVLEHFYQWASGQVPSYWDAPFMFPHGNVIAYSDNLLGTAPLYAFFRTIGADREDAFQLWIVGLFALNYAGCWLALWKWTRQAIVAACGAFIFAFGIYQLGGLNHVQMLPKWIMPLAFWWCWQWLRTKRTGPFAALALAVAYQFYCGMYLGFLLLYGLFFLVIAYVVVYRRASWAGFPRGKRLAAHAAALVGAGLALLPLIIPYAATLGEVPSRNYADTVDLIPRLRSHFFAHPGALSWRSLGSHSWEAFPSWWAHFHFMGALPWIAIVAAPFILLRKRLPQDVRRPIAVALLALGLVLLFCLNVGGTSLYGLVASVPGFSMMRSPDRIVHVQAMLFVLLFALVFHRLATAHRWAWPLLLVLPVLAVLDDRIDAGQVRRYDKYEAQREVALVERDIRLAWDSAHAALAYTRILPFIEWAEVRHDRRIDTHITAMLAAQQLHVPIVNAYTGSYPGNYMRFFDDMDRRSLADWCAFNGYDPARIQCIDNVGLPVLHLDTVALRSADGLYVSDDHDRASLAVADRKEVKRWEMFIRLQLTDTTVAFLANIDRFLCVDEEADDRLSATVLRPGSAAIFRLVPGPEGTTAFRCDNGRYVSVDPGSKVLHATADSIGPRELFRVERVQLR